MTKAADTNAPVLHNHQPRIRPNRDKRNGLDRTNVVYTLSRDGRPHPRGYTFRRSDARKIVPRRRFDLRTPSGMLKWHAHKMDTTRAQMAEVVGVNIRTLDSYFCNRKHLLRPWMVDALVPLLALAPDDVDRIHAAGVATLGWEPRA